MVERNLRRTMIGKVVSDKLDKSDAKLEIQLKLWRQDLYLKIKDLELLK